MYTVFWWKDYDTCRRSYLEVFIFSDLGWKLHSEIVVTGWITVCLVTAFYASNLKLFCLVNVWIDTLLSLVWIVSIRCDDSSLERESWCSWSWTFDSCYRNSKRILPPINTVWCAIFCKRIFNNNYILPWRIFILKACERTINDLKYWSQIRYSVCSWF